MIGFMLLLRTLVASFFAPREPLPTGLQVIEVMGHHRHIGHVRRVGGLYEVLEEPLGIAAGHHAQRRLYGPHAVFQIRDLTPEEQKTRDAQRAFEARPCRHCGQAVCPKKGRTDEDVHIAANGNTWCDRWAPSQGTLSAPEARQNPERVTCRECLNLLRAEVPPGRDLADLAEDSTDDADDGDPPPDSDEDVSYAHAGLPRRAPGFEYDDARNVSLKPTEDN